MCMKGNLKETNNTDKYTETHIKLHVHTKVFVVPINYLNWKGLYHKSSENVIIVRKSTQNKTETLES